MKNKTIKHNRKRKREQNNYYKIDSAELPMISICERETVLDSVIKETSLTIKGETLSDCLDVYEYIKKNYVKK
jgi:hypothetical protein